MSQSEMQRAAESSSFGLPEGVREEFILPDHSMPILVESLPGAVAMFDARMRYITANATWIAEMGFGEEDIVGRSHYDLFPQTHDTWRGAYESVLSGAAPGKRFETKEKGRAVIWEIRPWKDRRGGVGGLVVHRMKNPLEAEEREPGAPMVDALPFGLVRVNARQEILEFNPAAETLLGVRPAFARTFSDWLCSGLKSEETEAAREAFHEKVWARRHPLTLAVPSPNRQWRDVWIRPVELPTSDDLLLVLEDVTHRTLEEKSLRGSEARFRSLFEESPSPVVLLDSSGRIHELNAAATKKLGRRRQSLRDEPFESLLPLASIEAGMEALKMAQSGDRAEFTSESERWTLFPLRHGGFGPRLIACVPRAAVSAPRNSIREELLEKDAEAVSAFIREFSEKPVSESPMNTHRTLMRHLQRISSLLAMGERGSDTALPHLAALAALHRHLAVDPTAATLPFGAFLVDHVQRLANVFDYAGRSEGLTAHADEVALAPEAAFTAALLVNTLVEDALRHEYKEEARIGVNLVRDPTGHFFTLTVEDNGREGEACSTTDRQLEEIFVTELDAELTRGSEEGCRVSVKIPLSHV